MKLSRSMRAAAVALALTTSMTSLTGCVAAGARAQLSAEGRTHEGFASRTEPQPLEFGYDEQGPVGGLTFARGGGETIGLIAVMVFIIPFVILVDLITLPIALPNDRPFHCTHVVIQHCWR